MIPALLVLLLCVALPGASPVADTGASGIDTLAVAGEPHHTAGGVHDGHRKHTDERVTGLKPVRRDFNYRRQVGLALFMMGFAALMITTAQSWNPR